MAKPLRGIQGDASTPQTQTALCGPMFAACPYRMLIQFSPVRCNIFWQNYFPSVYQNAEHGDCLLFRLQFAKHNPDPPIPIRPCGDFSKCLNAIRSVIAQPQNPIPVSIDWVLRCGPDYLNHLSNLSPHSKIQNSDFRKSQLPGHRFLEFLIS